ncbi:benzoate/H(+) symporter BenE family transporter [Paenibacillus algorifonticola]|uniref:benzoate/H(+) symporter BenE family transporter n=1 Tax=Paenibacillus algorifonticola TaxID=684063 RepID=UPI003D2E481B
MLNTKNISSGLATAIMACTGGAVLIIQAADALGLSRAEALSWLFAVYVIGGALNLWLILRYKIPFAGAHSLTAVAFLSASALHYPIKELAGSFIMAGALIAVLGATGLFGKLLGLIPKPMLDAMLAGIVLHYVVAIIPAIKELPIIGLLSFLGFLIVPRLNKAIPPLLGMLAFGVIGLLIWHDFPAAEAAEFSMPHWISPSFTTGSFISISIPIAILILSNDIAVSLAALKKNGYHPPVNKTVVFSGLGTLLVGFFGGHAVNVGGMMTALCSSDEAGERKSRIWAGIVCSVLVIIFGVFAGAMLVLINRLPSAFIVLLSGFSLAGVLIGNLQAVFSETTYRFSTLFAFIIAIANVSFFGISSPVWSLLMGCLIAKVLKEGKPKPVEASSV